MRKKFLVMLFALISALCCLFGLAACGEADGNESGDGGAEPPVHTHTYTKWEDTIAATCTTDGERMRECSCGDKQTEVITMLGHNFKNYVSDDNATCTKDGTKTAKCDRCDETDTVEDKNSALNHSFVNYVTDGNATCTKDGTKTAKCERCDETDTVEDKNSALNHSFVNYVTDGNATCTKDGTKTAKCERCDETDTVEDEYSALGHSPSDWRCVRISHSIVCEVCEEIIKDNPHTFSNGECSVCGLVLNEYHNVFNGTYGYKYFGTLEKSKGLQGLYNAIDGNVRLFHDSEEDAVDDIVATIDFSEYGLNTEEAVSVWKTFRDDNPLYYWISTTVGCSDKIMVLYVDSAYADGEARAQQNQLIYKEIYKLTQLTKKEKSAYMLALAYHDEIINRIDYAFNEEGEPETAEWAHNICGVLEKTGAVCEGYARTFQILLNVSGVNNVFVTGDSRGQEHAWNLVQMDNGQWYWCDLTWDDSGAVKWGVTHNNFCGIDGNFLNSHTFDSSNASGGSFLYELPVRAKKAYVNDGVNIMDKFTVGNLEYAVDGYNTVILIKSTQSGNVVIPDTVEYLGRSYDVVAIYGYYNENSVTNVFDNTITSLNIGKNVRYIEPLALRGCSLLDKITLNNDNETFVLKDGVLFTKTLEILVLYPVADSRTAYAIPDETVFVAHNAFTYCDTFKYLECLSVGKNLEIFGLEGFTMWDDLGHAIGALRGKKQFSINEENPNFVIKENLIMQYTAGIYPDGTVYSGISVCAGMPDIEHAILSDIDDANVIEIQPYAFYNCTNLKSVTLPESLTRICNGAFSGCSNLKNVIIPDGIKEIEEGVFMGCSSLENITIPDSVTSIGFKTFKDCCSLKSISIPDSVTSISNYAFEGCSSLTEIVIPDGVTSIVQFAFAGCTSLKSIKLHDNITSIGGWAFDGCSNLESIVIGEGVNEIGINAFVKCNALKNVFYNGSSEEWDKIKIEPWDNSALLNAARYYYSEIQPTQEGNYWHYVGGEVVVW